MGYQRKTDARKKDRKANRRRINTMSITNLLNNMSTSDYRRNMPRDKYDEEEGIFIWYNRNDLGCSWGRVQENFQRQFRKRRGKGGLQCKYYRVLGFNHIAKVRCHKSGGPRRPEDRALWGVVAKTGFRYPWMLPHHQRTPFYGTHA